MRRADRAAPVLRDADLSGGPRHGGRPPNRLPCPGSAQQWHRYRGSICLRQRHGLDHERKLSGARHHARDGPDLRLHRRPPPCTDLLRGACPRKRTRKRTRRATGRATGEGTIMKNPAAGFGVNTYSYIFDGSAADTVARLADQGYGGVELMFFPGHLWPAELDASQLRGLRQLCEARLRLVAVNMPNVDMNIAAAAEEMRAYTLDLLIKFVRCAGELGAGGIIVGPGKANPLFPMPRDRMISYFYRALDVLAPLARQVGTRLFIENMPFAFLPDAESLMKAVDGYGDDSIRVIYDVANAHFIGEAPTDGLRRVRDRLSLVHFSDTTRQSYKHDPLGRGDVPLAGIPSAMKEIGYSELPMLEVISLNPDPDIADSCRRLHQAGFGRDA